jgi:VWFA-related protein
MRLTFFLILVLCAFAAAQQPQPKPAQPPTEVAAATFSSSTQLVVETVTVTDKSGKPIQGLTQKDFTVTEDNAPQAIKFFEYQELPDAAEPPLPVQPLKADVLNRFPSTKISAEVPGSTKYRDHRLLALYFDLTAMGPTDQIRALEAAQKFISTQMTKADLLSIMLFEGAGVRVLQDFTDDRDRLSTIIQTIAVGEGQGFDETAADAGAADTGAAFGQDDSEFNLFNTDRQLAALQTAVHMLGQLSEKKQLLFFASGIKLNGIDNQATLHATVNAAIRAGVSFWPLDARGLMALSPLGDATRAAPGGASMYNGQAAMAMNSGFQQSQDTLYTLASDTGGKAFLDSNDLSAGIVKAQHAISSYYIIGYYTTNQALDGKFRRVKITLNNGLAASIDFRQGYFSNKTFNKFTTADKDRQLEDAMMLGDPITELTIKMEVNYFQLNRAEYFIPIVAKIPGSELVLARKGGAQHTLLDFLLEVKDDYGSTMQSMRDKADIPLSDKTAAELAKSPIEYDAGVTLLPGKYTVKFLARDAETGHIGTYMNTFIVPNLLKEEKRIPISSVVLSSQRIDVKDALFNAEKDKERARTQAVNPLIADGKQLMPSVTRVFSKNRDMYVYLQAYERTATTAEPLVAFVTFYRGQTKAFETAPVPITDGLDPKTKALPIRFNIGLDKLPVGEYNCQVTVLDPGNQKVAYWQSPVMLVQ